MPYFIGLMSGTSADGINAALVKFENKQVMLVDTEFFLFSQVIKKTIQSLQFNRDLSYHRVAELNIKLGELFAKVCNILISRNPKISIHAIGCHGQTIQHQPGNKPAYTLQIGSGAVIAESTGITTVNNFRVRDITVSGQGAPLAPAFHHAVFDNKLNSRIIVNIGGISNITYLSPGCKPVGFDSGPGNTLMDLWCRDNFNKPYDRDGKLAKQGKVNKALLNTLINDEYFGYGLPKSTGQEYFNKSWLLKKSGTRIKYIKSEDILTTLTMLTAKIITLAIKQFCPGSESIYICGGGAHNRTLMRFLKKSTKCAVSTTKKLGIGPDWVEACAFAWFASQTLLNKPVDLTSVTGANKPCNLGSIWPSSAQRPEI